MSIELNPVGVKCNMQCPYCYEEPLRDAGNFSTGYNLELMKKGLLKENYRFSLFGGEPLLMPFKDLEEIFRWGLEKFQSNGIQPHGSLITEEHIQMFIKYKVHVGISMDGPEGLNDSRWMGTLEKTREATKRSQWAIQRLCEVGRHPSIIFTLYKGNASPGKLPELLDWLQEFDDFGMRYVRIHLLEVENPEVRKQMALSDSDTILALTTLKHFEGKLKTLRFDLFSDMAKLLTGNDGGSGVSCIWNACDPYTTQAVRGVDGMGNHVNCGRVNKEGVDWGKAETAGYERYLALYAAPQEHGGCKDCRFFFACKGQCPGTGIDGDWRNRTEQCVIWYDTFSAIERDLLRENKNPLSLSPQLKALESTLISNWEAGRNLSVAQAVATMNGEPLPTGRREHGDHWDAPDGYEHADGDFDVHGDAGTTIMHGDSDR